MVCTRPLSAPYSLITRSRSAADGNLPRQVRRVWPLPRSSKVTVVRELHRLDVFAAAVVIDDALRLHDLVEGNAVLIVAAVGAMHDEAPDAARAEIECNGRGGEAVRTPPLRQMLGIGPHRQHQIARRVEHARADDRARILLQGRCYFLRPRFFSFACRYTQIIVEPVETLFPEPAIVLEPVVDFLERARLDPAGPPSAPRGCA